MAMSPQQQSPADGQHHEFYFPSLLFIFLPTVPGNFLTLMAQGEARRPSENKGFVWDRRTSLHTADFLKGNTPGFRLV